MNEIYAGMTQLAAGETKSPVDRNFSNTNKKKTVMKEHAKPTELIFEFDLSSSCRWVNDDAAQKFGDVRGQSLAQVFSAYPKVIEQYQRIDIGHEFIYFEVPDAYNWVIQTVRDDNGQLTGAVVTASALVAESPPLVLPSSVWAYNLLTDQLTVSEAVSLVFGFTDTAVDFSAARSAMPIPMGMLRDGCRRLFLRDAEFFLKEFQFKDATDRVRWVSVRGQVSSIDSSGHVIGLNGSIEDITARVTELNNRHDLEYKILRVQKMEAIGELAGGIAHDFNNILTSIMGYTELALMESLQETNSKMSTYLQEVYQGGRRARELVGKMLTFSRTDQIQPQNFALMQQVKDIVKMLRASLPSSIEIRIDIDEGLPEVFIDESFLQQMIMNICINSRDAMPDGGTIYIRGRTRLVRRGRCDSCHSEFVGDYVELSIEDTGCGISDTMLNKVFEPYATTKEEGSGMGLAMVHGIMHRQGGHIMVDSLHNDGTEIRVFLKPSESYGINSPIEPYVEVSREENTTNKHILVIDDEVSLVYFLRELLQKKGYVVTVASDSHEAWDLFSATPDKFHLVLTDQTMPGMSGVQLAAKMLTLREDLPIILCTGYSDVVDETNINQYGIMGYMPKPINTKELLESVKELLVV
ncbi:MAG: response regulator [Pseudomonadales bacterium]|nr:response regulator [Pseudomonadales bacterium]